MATKKTTETEAKAEQTSREQELEKALAEMKKQLKAVLKEKEDLETKAEPVAESNWDQAYWDELVPHFEPFTDDDSDSISVKVNGRRFQIKRGEDVMIPRFVKQVIEDRNKQLNEARRGEKALQQDFENQTTKYFG